MRLVCIYNLTAYIFCLTVVINPSTNLKQHNQPIPLLKKKLPVETNLHCCFQMSPRRLQSYHQRTLLHIHQMFVRAFFLTIATSHQFKRITRLEKRIPWKVLSIRRTPPNSRHPTNVRAINPVSSQFRLQNCQRPIWRSSFPSVVWFTDASKENTSDHQQSPLDD